MHIHFADLLRLLVTLGLGGGVLVRELVVALVQTGALLLEGLEVAVLLLELLAELGDFTGVTGNGELLALLGVALGALIAADLVLQTHHLKDHNVGAVKDEGEEEGEAAKVHVALGVELAGLHLKALVTHDGGAVRHHC